MTGTSYVISTARARFEAWAAHLGKSITSSNGDYVISGSKPSVSVINSNASTTTIIIVAVALSMLSFGGYLLIKRKKQ